MIAEYAGKIRGLGRDVKLLLVCIMLFNFSLMGIYPVLFFSSYLVFSQNVVPSRLRSRASGVLYLAAGIGQTVE